MKLSQDIRRTQIELGVAKDQLEWANGQPNVFTDSERKYIYTLVPALEKKLAKLLEAL